MKEFRDYSVRVWTGTVFIDSTRTAPGVSYMGDRSGHGMQCDTYDDKKRAKILAACESVADAMRELDRVLDEQEPF